jgi:cell division protein FtsW
MRLTRADRSLVAEWWFTVDRRLLAVLLILVASGLVLSLAASPAVAVKKGLPPFYFAERHALFAGIGVALMLVVSLLDPRALRRLALAVLIVSLGFMAWALVGGVEIKGASRWVRIGGHSLQPSEIGKPALVVLLAWLFAESTIRRDVPALPLAVALGALFGGLLVLQPDLGQTLLVGLVWGALLLLSGQPLRWVALLVPVGAAGFGLAWLTFPHVRSRIARFLDPASGDTYQIDRAIRSFTEGGLLGRGPGEGTIKTTLPDAHTDFPFAVIGEEYGALACLALLALYAAIGVRAVSRTWREPDPFVRLAVVGLALLIVLQAAINMGVNVGLLPTKGMTLPFISAGGSSSLGVALTAGFLLGIARRRPGHGAIPAPQLRPTADGMVAR